MAGRLLELRPSVNERRDLVLGSMDIVPRRQARPVRISQSASQDVVVLTEPKASNQMRGKNIGY